MISYGKAPVNVIFESAYGKNSPGAGPPGLWLVYGAIKLQEALAFGRFLRPTRTRCAG